MPITTPQKSSKFKSTLCKTALGLSYRTNTTNTIYTLENYVNKHIMNYKYYSDLVRSNHHCTRQKIGKNSAKKAKNQIFLNSTFFQIITHCVISGYNGKSLVLYIRRFSISLILVIISDGPGLWNRVFATRNRNLKISPPFWWFLKDKIKFGENPLWLTQGNRTSLVHIRHFPPSSWSSWRRNINQPETQLLKTSTTYH